MKLAELFQGPKPTPSPLPRGGARGEAPDGKTSDFADALNEARKRPEPKPTAAEKPVAKKPPAARNGEAEEQPVDDATAAEPSQVEEADTAVPTDESPVEDESTPFAEEESEASSEHEPSDVAADLSAIALAQASAPQPAVIEDEQPADVELKTPPLPQMICPPKLNQPTQPAVAATEDAESVTDAEVSSGVSEMFLERMEEAPDSEGEPLPEELDLDAAPGGEATAKAPSKPHATAAPVKPVEASDPTDAPKPELKDTNDAQDALSSTNQFAMNAGTTVGEEPLAPTSPTVADTSAPTATASAHMQPETVKPQAAPQAPVAQAPPPPPQAHFIEANHPKLVSAIQTQALTNGGTMQIRLDPPELGALQVMVHMQDGVMTASFHTSNDDATKLLSHSLSQLKQVLESQGVSVERLQVQQAPKDQHAQNDDPHQQNQRDQHADAHRQEQQRKEMLRRMWRRLSNGSDPLDLVA